ncbi:hypothetical protein QVD17_17862 [Tagetes erecta]|uniref:Stigma-specific STIG1-like protein 1 n=1 Tax=Tagetes erecta TaxID=13708 RepID=A0AAD8KGG7_TARER|nr:hypothetical protein QVD17_17862 [Tagetes erecta]
MGSLRLFLFTFSLIIVPLLSASNEKTNILDANKSKTDQVLNPLYQCDIYPRVCRARGGVAPDCCKKKCVNVETDCLNCGSCGKKCKSGETCCKGKCVDLWSSRSNCGLCGMKCRYNETCCKGKCRNIYFDNKNCGACHNKCKHGESCAFGMCNYA